MQSYKIRRFSNVKSDAISDTIATETKHCKVRSFSPIILGLSSFLAGYTLSILAPLYSKETQEHGISLTASATVAMISNGPLTNSSNMSTNGELSAVVHATDLAYRMSAKSSFEQNYPSLREDLYLHCLWLIGRRKNIFLPRSPQSGPGYSRAPRKELQGDMTVRTRNNLCPLKEQPHHHQQPLPHPNEHHEHEDSPRLRDRNS